MTAIRLKKATTTDYDIMVLVAESARDPYLGDFATTKNITDVVAFYVGKVAVGFAIPRRDSDGRYRTGPIYISPDQRKKGYAKQYVSLYFKDKPGRAYIDPTNIASQRLFASVGFVKSGKVIKSDGISLDEWVTPAKAPSSFKW